MNGRFRSFSFVDRITHCSAGRVAGHYTVPAGATRFPASLMAEAVGQLAAWAAMSQLDFAWRPVAGLAGEARYGRTPRMGDRLELQADIERCDAEAVAYRGRATIEGELAVEIVDCVGPMLPMDQFDDPEAVRADFQTLLQQGAAADRFGGVPDAALSQIEVFGSERVQAVLTVPLGAAAPYFDDHFPRRPVFPGTLLLDALAGLAVQLAWHSDPLRNATALAPTRLTHMKIRSFTEPGAVLQLQADLVEADAKGARLKLSASADGKTVATARIDVAPKAAR